MCMHTNVCTVRIEQATSSAIEEYSVSLALQVVLAKEAGLSYGAVALVTDYDCWRDNEISVSPPSDLTFGRRRLI
jgi:hypothetical protein